MSKKVDNKILTHAESVTLAAELIRVGKRNMRSLETKVDSHGYPSKTKVEEFLMVFAESFDLSPDLVKPGEGFARKEKRKCEEQPLRKEKRKRDEQHVETANKQQPPIAPLAAKYRAGNTLTKQRPKHSATSSSDTPLAKRSEHDFYKGDEAFYNYDCWD